MPWPNGYRLAEKIEPVYYHAKERRQEVFVEYAAAGSPLNPDSDDPRARVLQAIFVSLQYVQLNAHFVEKSVRNRSWWLAGDEVIDPDGGVLRREGFNVTPEAVEAAYHHYYARLALSLALLPLFHFEDCVRRIITAVEATACSGGAAPFENCYRWLFKRLRDSDAWQHQEAEDFLDLYRNVRNSLAHNNNTYLHPRGSDADREIVWRDETYPLRHGRPLSWADDADFVISLVRELIDLTASILRSPTVRDLAPIT